MGTRLWAEDLCLTVEKLEPLSSVGTVYSFSPEDSDCEVFTIEFGAFVKVYNEKQLDDIEYAFTVKGGGWGYIHKLFVICKDGTVVMAREFNDSNILDYTEAFRFNYKNSGVDFQNMLNALKQSYKLQSTDKAYICYAVDLVNSIIYFEAFEAVDLKGARNTACTYLSNTLGEKVLVKNLQLNANKNSKVAHANNLANAYIGRLNEMNKYGTYSKYLVGCVKLSSGLIHTQILDDWVYQCY